MNQKECEALGGTWTSEGTCVFIRKLPTAVLHQGPCGGFLEVRYRFRKTTEPRPLALVNPLERNVRILKTLMANAQRTLALSKAGGGKGAASAKMKKETKAGYRSASKKK